MSVKQAYLINVIGINIIKCDIQQEHVILKVCDFGRSEYKKELFYIIIESKVYSERSSQKFKIFIILHYFFIFPTFYFSKQIVNYLNIDFN